MNKIIGIYIGATNSCVAITEGKPAKLKIRNKFLLKTGLDAVCTKDELMIRKVVPLK